MSTKDFLDRHLLNLIGSRKLLKITFVLLKYLHEFHIFRRTFGPPPKTIMPFNVKSLRIFALFRVVSDIASHAHTLTAPRL